MKNLTISVRSHFSKEQLENLLDTAGRGASYWCNNNLEYPSKVQKVLSGESVSIMDIEKNKHYWLNLKAVKRGLTTMAKKESKHFADFISEDFDQTTGDIFLQCCLFGKVIYG